MKPSIYDPPAPTRELIRNDPTPLEAGFRDVRRRVLTVYSDGHAAVRDIVDKWIGLEKQVEKTLHEVAPKGEETIIPGAIYVGIAGMGGSILARNRNCPRPSLFNTIVHPFVWA
jgi:MICOS complex subunit MIC26